MELRIRDLKRDDWKRILEKNVFIEDIKNDFSEMIENDCKEFTQESYKSFPLVNRMIGRIFKVFAPLM